jgi:DNA repair exonuclease SbcCD ATPase subunit
MKLTIDKIQYKNLLSVGKNPITIKLSEDDRTMIVGSNGSGKSTLLEALTFGLYGTPFRNITKAGLVSRQNKKELVVTIWFTHGVNAYKIIRGMKPDIFEIYKDDTLQHKDAASKDQQALLEKNVLAMDVKTFKQICVLGTAGFQPFLTLSAADRRAVVDTMTDTAKLTRMNANGLAVENVLKGQCALLESELGGVESTLNAVSSMQTEQQSGVAEKISVLNAEKATLKERYIELITNKSTAHDEKQAAIDSLDGKWEPLYDELKRNVTTKKADIARKTHEKTHIENLGGGECPTCQQSIGASHVGSVVGAINSTVEGIQNELLALKDSSAELVGRKSTDELIHKEISVIESSEFAIDRDISTLKALVNVNKQRIAELSKPVESSSINVGELQSKRNLIKTDLRNAKNRLQSVRSLRKLLKDDGIKASLMANYIPSINRLVNQYFADMGVNIRMEFDTSFSESITFAGQKNVKYESFSQGERYRIDLAILFAFREFVGSRTGSQCNLLILDEVLDGASDDAGIKAFNNILNGLSGKDNVVVISHDDKHDVSKYQRKLETTKLGHYSVIKEIKIS